jgi:peptide-methionine (S)-S-oxide reductase
MRFARVRLSFVYSTLWLLALAPLAVSREARAASVTPFDTGFTGPAAMSSLGAAISNPILELIRAKAAGSLAIAASDTAYFAGGSFWALEAAFESRRGVTAATTGYVDKREAVEVVFDPRIATYEDLLEIYWNNVDPTQADGQICDVGPQYRSAIYWSNSTQRDAAFRSARALAARGVLRGAVATEILPARSFERAPATEQDVHRKQRDRYRAWSERCDRARRLAAIWNETPPTVTAAEER